MRKLIILLLFTQFAFSQRLHQTIQPGEAHPYSSIASETLVIMSYEYYQGGSGLEPHVLIADELLTNLNSYIQGYNAGRRLPVGASILAEVINEDMFQTIIDMGGGDYFTHVTYYRRTSPPNASPSFHRFYENNFYGTGQINAEFNDARSYRTDNQISTGDNVIVSIEWYSQLDPTISGTFVYSKFIP